MLRPRSSTRPALSALALGLSLLLPAPAHASDVDGPDDCARVTVDFGDAPEGIPAYPGGTPGRFPTCNSMLVPVGTVDGPCPPNFLVPPPGSAVGWVSHTPYETSNFWLGCYPRPGGYAGIDSEFEAKVNTPATGVSACDASRTTDCVATAFFGMTFDQDECEGDGSDAGLQSSPFLVACLQGTVNFTTTNCGDRRLVYLNLLLDMNHDGDWLDSFSGCEAYGTPGCIHEWALQNVPLFLDTGACESHTSPAFPIGGSGGPAWLRISISADPANLNYPWQGTQYMGGPHFPPIAQFTGGETEDYPLDIIAPPLPVLQRSWGEVKLRYR